MAMKVRECCCGCSLQTGTIIIGLFLLIFSVITIFGSSVDLYSLSTLEDDERDTFMEFQNQFGDTYESKTEPKVFLIAGIVAGAVQLIVNALLLIGVFKERRILVIIWLVANAVICGLGILGFVISYFKYDIDPNFQVGIGIGIGLHLYFLLIVWNFQKSPEAGHNRQRNAADVYNTENCNIKRMPLEQPI